MKIMDRYIGGAVIGGTLLVMMILLGLFSFVTFLTELDDVGRGRYGVWQAAEYVLLLVPRLTYQMFPLAALLGSLIGLGMMAGNNELVVLRAAGVSLQRIISAVMKAALLLMITAVLISEFVAPASEQYARTMRSMALSENSTQLTQGGFWTRTGDSYINVQTVLADGQLTEVQIYEFDAGHRLRRLTQAKSAQFKDQQWQLRNIVRSEFISDRVSVQHIETLNWQSLLSPDMLDVIAVKPQSLSGWGLYQYIQYLKGNELDAGRYEMEMWIKIILPLATGVMVLLAVPFVFGSLRSVGIGQRIMMGSLIGIVFYLLNQVFSYVGLVYQLNAVVSAVLPTLLFFVLAVILLRRVY